MSSSKQSIKLIQIESLSHEGAGIGRAEDGKVVFVEGALPSERVEYLVTENKKRFIKGQLKTVLDASDSRVDARCKVYDSCGGCALQHLSHDQQLHYKQKQLLDNFRKFAKLEVENIYPVIQGEAWNYRRRVRLSLAYDKKRNTLSLGFKAKQSNKIQEIEACDIVDKAIEEKFEAIQNLLESLQAKDKIYALECCLADNGLALVFLSKNELPTDDLERLSLFSESESLSVYTQAGQQGELKSLASAKPLQYNINQDVQINFSVRDFIQVNAKVNSLLVEKVIQELDLQEDDHVLDLFSGLGNFSLPVAKYAEKVVGVEGEASLVEGAKKNSELNNFQNTDFYLANLFEEDQSGSWWSAKYSKIIIDPPRAGALSLIKQIARFKAKKIVYVSCDAATLARDASILVNDLGYSLQGAGIADMFPQTAHVESIAVFEKAKLSI